MMPRELESQLAALSKADKATAEDLVHAWAYAETHRREIGDEIRANEAA